MPHLLADLSPSHPVTRSRLPPASSAQQTHTRHLPRTYGAGTRGPASGSSPGSDLLFSQSLRSIVQRTSTARADAFAQVRARTGGSVVQRLISARQFGKNTNLTLRKGKSGTFFANVKARLRRYHNPPQQQSNAEKVVELQKLYAVLDAWEKTGRPRKSSRADPVTALKNEIMQEIQQLQPVAMPSAKLTVESETASESESDSDSDSDYGSVLEYDSESESESEEDLANTTPVVAKSRGVDAVNAPIGNETPEQLDAITVIDGTGMSKGQKLHAHNMIRNPEVIQQGAFGVCGLTSILYAVARSNPKRFAEIIREAWADDELVKKWLPVYTNNATTAHQLLNAEVEYVAAQWLVRKSAAGKVTQKALEPGQDAPTDAPSKEKVYEDVYKRQVEFSDQFEIQGWENTLGHFAITSGGLSFLMNALGTGKPSYKLKIKDFDKDYKAARARAGKGSVLASVTNTDFYKGAQPVDNDFVKTRKPKYVHWVVLNEAADAGNYFNLKLWTWGANWDAQIRKDVIQSHIYSFIAAEAEQ